MKDRGRSGHEAREEARSAGSPPAGSYDVRSLFRAHASFVASFLRRLGTPSSDVDDLVQEVFLVAHRKGGYKPGSGQPRTWLGAIALRVASTHKRTRRRRREESNDEALLRAPATDDVASALETRRSLQRVQRALDTLELEQCAAFVLFEFEGESCENIANSLGIPVGTVYSRLHHARKRFLQAYDAAGSELQGDRRRLITGET